MQFYQTEQTRCLKAERTLQSLEISQRNHSDELMRCVKEERGRIEETKYQLLLVKAHLEDLKLLEKARQANEVTSAEQVVDK